MPTLIEDLANHTLAEAPSAPSMAAIERRASKTRSRRMRLRSAVGVGFVISLAIIAKPVFTSKPSQTVAAGSSDTAADSEGQAIHGDRSDLTNRFSPGLLPFPDNELGASVLWPPEGEGMGRPDDVVQHFLDYLAPDLHLDITIDQSRFSARSGSLTVEGDLVELAGRWHIRAIDGIDGLEDSAKHQQFDVPEDWPRQAHIAVHLRGLHFLTVTSYPTHSVMGIPDLPSDLSGEFSLLILLYDMDGNLLEVAGASGLAWPPEGSTAGTMQSTDSGIQTEPRPAVSNGDCIVEMQVYNASMTSGVAGVTTHRINEAIGRSSELSGELLLPANSDRVLEETVVLVGPDARCFDVELLDIGRPYTQHVGSIPELFAEFKFEPSELKIPDNAVLIFMGRN